jgi:hypothetical protein
MIRFHACLLHAASLAARKRRSPYRQRRLSMPWELSLLINTTPSSASQPKQ